VSHHAHDEATASSGTSAPRLALRRAEAAAALGVSLDSFDRHVRPHLRVLRLGSVRLYPVSEIERWLAEGASSPAEDVGLTSAVC